MKDECPMLLCGDFNSRISDKCDYIDNVEYIRQRNTIDKTCNSHGEQFLDFCRDSCYVLNGRFDRTLDNYTCISKRGVSVVDYIVCDVPTLSIISDFMVQNISDTIEQLHVYI